jgi:hypothetical protein
MRPTQNHEREITEAVEHRCQEPGCCYLTAIVDVTKTMPFLLSQSDTKHLIQLVKQKCPQTLDDDPKESSGSSTNTVRVD